MSEQPWAMRFTLVENARAGDVLEVFDLKRGYARRARASAPPAPEEETKKQPEDFAGVHTDTQHDAIHRVRKTPIPVTFGGRGAEGTTPPASEPFTAEERAHVDACDYLSPFTPAWVTPGFARWAVNQIVRPAARRVADCRRLERDLGILFNQHTAIHGYDGEAGGTIRVRLVEALQAAAARAEEEEVRYCEVCATVEALAQVTLGGLFGLEVLAMLNDEQFAKQRATGGTGERERDGG